MSVVLIVFVGLTFLWHLSWPTASESSWYLFNSRRFLLILIESFTSISLCALRLWPPLLLPLYTPPPPHPLFRKRRLCLRLTLFLFFYFSAGCIVFVLCAQLQFLLTCPFFPLLSSHSLSLFTISLFLSSSFCPFLRPPLLDFHLCLSLGAFAFNALFLVLI